METLLKAPAFWPLILALGLYWAYCLLSAVLYAPLVYSKHARDYFIAGRSLGFWSFIAAATATSFSGWTFISHPEVIYKFGFPAAFASFYAITIPLAGVFFLKRQWMLGQRCGFVTPGEMFYAYFKSEVMRYLVVVVAVLYSIFYIAVQLRATGYLFNIITDGHFTIEQGIWVLSIVLLLYVTLGGLKTVAYVDGMQAILLAVGILALGVIVLFYVGNNFQEHMQHLAQFYEYFQGNSKHFVIQNGWWYSNKEKAMEALGSYWTVPFILTFLFALMGIQSSPAFSMWAFSARDARAFGMQQVWASSFGMGLVMMIFTASIGIGSHFLGADYSLRESSSEIANKNILGIFINDEDISRYEAKTGTEALVPLLIRITLEIFPPLLGLLALGALAAIQSTAASYMSTVGSILSRDLLKNGWCTVEKNQKGRKTWRIFFAIVILILFLAPLSEINHFTWLMFIPLGFTWGIHRLKGDLGDGGQKWMAVLFTIIITLSAIQVAIVSGETLVFMGALAVAYGVQMMPALTAICWIPFLTPWGIMTGLSVGLIVVTLTELTPEVFPFAVGQWPGTIHSAVWGLSMNLIIAITLSFIQRWTGQDTGKEHRQKFHRFLNDPDLQNLHAPEKKVYHSSHWLLILSVVMIWAFFAIGPGALMGNSIFGNPTDSETWKFGIPSLWAWQILWWLIGVGMMGWLAYYWELSTPSKAENAIEPLNADISEAEDKYCENIYSNPRGQ